MSTMYVLVSCDKNSASSVNVWNPQNGSKLMSLRGPTALSRSLSFIRNEGFAIAEAGKPFVHIWQAGSSFQNSKRMLCPGKVNALAWSPNGNFVAVAIKENITIWQPATGRIAFTLGSGHFRDVTCLEFASDSSYLVSGGDDGLVLAWKFVPVWDVDVPTLPVTYIWPCHSFAVTDILIGMGGYKARVYSVSTDRTMKIYSLLTGDTILSIAFPGALVSIAADPVEYCVYVGSCDGNIYGVIPDEPRKKDSNYYDGPNVFKKHECRVTALAVSPDGRVFASGDDSGAIYIWSPFSRSVIKTIKEPTHSKDDLTVTNLKFWLGNPEELSFRVPKICIPAVPKLISTLPEDSNRATDSMLIWNRQDNLECYSSIDKTNDAAGSNLDLLSDICALKSQLCHAETMNENLKKYCVDSILDAPPPPQMSQLPQWGPRLRKRLK